MSEAHESETAFELLPEGIGRRDLLKATAAVGAGAMAPAWLASSGVTEAAAATRRGSQYRILQPGEGPHPGVYIRATPENVRWGTLPNGSSRPVRTVRSGTVVTFDTVSHEGILEDQGRNPLKYLRSKGVPAREVLRDAIAIAGSDIPHDFAKNGPHIINGPVAISGAEPGDVLQVDILHLLPRVPYGVISNRHGKGALPGEFPEGPLPDPNASAAHPELFHNVSVFTPLRRIRGRDVLVLPVNSQLRAVFPFEPFLGTMGVALTGSEPTNSVPPSRGGGGNLDLKDLQVGSRLYLPIQVPGAKFFVGDPHFSQGDGEVALTAVEGSLRATLRLTLLKQGSNRIPGNAKSLTAPFAETPDYWVPIGLDEDLDEAMKEAVRQAIAFLHGEFDMPKAMALAYLSAATDFAVGEVVDKVKQVHGHIVKSHFVRRPGKRS